MELFYSAGVLQAINGEKSMKKSLFLFTFILATASINFSQDFVRPPVSTTAPSTLRHEIIENPSMTLRLDKYTGRVFWLSQCSQRSNIGVGQCWKETIVLELPKPNSESSVRYQIFAQSGNNRLLLLIDTTTGKTWQLGIEDGLYKWTPLIDTVPLPQSFEIVR